MGSESPHGASTRVLSLTVIRHGPRSLNMCMRHGDLLPASLWLSYSRVRALCQPSSRSRPSGLSTLALGGFRRAYRVPRHVHSLRQMLLHWCRTPVCCIRYTTSNGSEAAYWQVKPSTRLKVILKIVVALCRRVEIRVCLWIDARYWCKNLVVTPKRVVSFTYSALAVATMREG